MKYRNKYKNTSCGDFSYGIVQGDMRILKRGDMAWSGELDYRSLL